MLDPRYAQLLKRTFVDYRQTSEILENPLIMERAEALYYWDIHGRRYFDAITPFSPALGLVQRLFQGVPRESKFLAATYGKSVEKAQAEPHAILYRDDDLQQIDGVRLAMTWTFHHWSADKGIHDGKPLGRAEVSNVAFVGPEPGTFDKPGNAREAPMPEDQ